MNKTQLFWVVYRSESAEGEENRYAADFYPTKEIAQQAIDDGISETWGNWPPTPEYWTVDQNGWPVTFVAGSDQWAA